MDKCSTCQYNPQILDRLKNQLPDEDVTDKLSEMFKVFGDSTRIRILWTLFDKELCVYDIANALGMSQSAISHQLKTLKQARLIKSRRDGKNTVPLPTTLPFITMESFTTASLAIVTPAPITELITCP